jgi:hypothetical protein
MPLRILMDEDSLGNDLWNAILTHNTAHPQYALDVMRVGDDGAPQSGTQDPQLIRWCASEGRILISKDKKTLIDHYYDAVNSGVKTSGLLIIKPNSGIRAIVDHLILITYTSDESDLSDKHDFIPN